MNDECCICGNHITPEHGGIVCKRCGSVFCCDSNCMPDCYIEKSVGYSQESNGCPICTRTILLNRKLLQTDIDSLINLSYLPTLFVGKLHHILCNLADAVEKLQHKVEKLEKED